MGASSGCSAFGPRLKRPRLHGTVPLSSLSAGHVLSGAEAFLPLAGRGWKRTQAGEPALGGEEPLWPTPKDDCSPPVPTQRLSSPRAPRPRRQKEERAAGADQLQVQSLLPLLKGEVPHAAVERGRPSALAQRHPFLAFRVRAPCAARRWQSGRERSAPRRPTAAPLCSRARRRRPAPRRGRDASRDGTCSGPERERDLPQPRPLGPASLLSLAPGRSPATGYPAWKERGSGWASLDRRRCGAAASLGRLVGTCAGCQGAPFARTAGSVVPQPPRCLCTVQRTKRRRPAGIDQAGVPQASLLAPWHKDWAPGGGWVCEARADPSWPSCPLCMQPSGERAAVLDPSGSPGT